MGDVLRTISVFEQCPRCEAWGMLDGPVIDYREKMCVTCGYTVYYDLARYLTGGPISDEEVNRRISG